MILNERKKKEQHGEQRTTVTLLRNSIVEKYM